MIVLESPPRSNGWPLPVRLVSAGGGTRCTAGALLDALRSVIGVLGSFDVVLPTVLKAPGRTSFEDLAAATDCAGAELLLVSRKISTLIGTTNVVAHRQGIDRGLEQL